MNYDIWTIYYSTGMGSSSGKITFVLEGQRALSKVTGNTLAALAGVLLGGNADSIARSWSSRPLLVGAGEPSASAAGVGVVRAINKPTRMSFDAKNKLLYIADTGKDYKYECKLTQQRTRH